MLCVHKRKWNLLISVWHMVHVHMCWKFFTTWVKKWEWSFSVRHLTLGVGLPVTWHWNVRLPPSWILYLEGAIVTSGRPESSRGDGMSVQRWAQVANVMVHLSADPRLFLFLETQHRAKNSLICFLATRCSYCMWLKQQCWAHLFPGFHCTCLLKALIRRIGTANGYYFSFCSKVDETASFTNI